MDIVREILQVMKNQDEAVTLCHIAYQTGFARSTLVGIMMAMITQGFVTELRPKEQSGETVVHRCTCLYCSGTENQEGSSSRDPRRYRISKKGERLLMNWSNGER